MAIRHVVDIEERRMKKLAISGALVFALSGLAGMQAHAAEEMGLIDTLNVIKQAEAAIKKAKKVDGEWRDSSKKFLAEAKEAANHGDTALALKLAKKAKFEGEMGYQQAMDQKNAGPWMF